MYTDEQLKKLMKNLNIDPNSLPSERYYFEVSRNFETNGDNKDIIEEIQKDD